MRRAASPAPKAGASLADERDRLIETIAERLDVAVTINGDGSATLKSGSDANVAILDGDLLRYQQAYNASARIIQVARETIDALFAAL